MSNIPGWKAILSNGDTFEGGDISSWRTLKTKCDQENLKIKSLLRKEEEVDPHPAATSYFIIYDQISSLLNKKSRTRIAFGSFRANGKARLQWEVIKDQLGDKGSGNYTEIITPNEAIWKELSIEIRR